MKQLVTIRQMAAGISVSPRHLQSLMARRLIPFVKLGRSVRLDPEAVNRALEKLTVREVS